MGPMVPNGRDAVAAWRSLDSAQRRTARAAAKIGAAPPDAALAAVMAGYGWCCSADCAGPYPC